MKIQKIALLLALVIFFSAEVYANVLLSDQGGDVREISSGNLLSLGNLTITIHTESSAGVQIYSQSFPNAIVNGSWNVMITPDLQFGQHYWKDYEINGEDLDFDGNERVEFQSPLGLINNVSFINFSLISSCPTGSAIRYVYANGSVECQNMGNGSGGSSPSSLIAGGSYLYNDSLAIYLNEATLNSTIDARTIYSNGSGLELTGKVFRLITTCSDNQLLKWNSTSSGWYCGNDLVGSADLTGYALKNQSETFTGNITTTQTGFFGFLGSIAQRITKLFVSDIDVSNNVEVTGNVTASKFIGDGSGLTNIPQGISYTHLSNLTDNLGNRGYTSLSNFTNDPAFINASQAQAFNESVAINGLNTSLSAQISSIPTANRSFNQSLTDSLYAASQWGYNQTNAANAYTTIINQTLTVAKLDVTDQRYNETNYIGSVNTSLTGRINSLASANASFNQSLTDGLYANARWNYNQTTTANEYTNSVNASQTSWISATFVRISDLFAQYLNISEIRMQYYNRSDIESRGYVNNTQIQNYNETSLINAVNQSLTANKLDVADQRYNDTSYVNNQISGISGNINATYNETYNRFAYNQTYTGGMYNATYAAYAYNQSDGSYNSTYAQFAYNQTMGTYNATYDRFAYNQTYVGGTYNATYAQFAYNQTYTGGTFNATYSSFAYNQTTAANAYADALNASQTTWVSATFLRISNALADYFNKTQIQGQYYNKTDIDSRGYANTSQLVTYNDTLLVNMVNQTLSSSKLDVTDQRYNNSAQILEVNQSLTARINTIPVANTSFNQSLTDSLYAANQWGYNQTDAAVTTANTYTSNVNLTQYNWISSTFLKINDALTQYFNKSDVQTAYYNRSDIDSRGYVNATQLSAYNDTTYVNSQISTNNASWSSTYNATYDAKTSGNASWNESRANSLYASSQWNYNQTTLSNDYTNTVNATQGSWITSTFLKITDAISQYLNVTDIRAQYYNKTDIDSRGYVNSSQINIYNDTALINTVNSSLTTRIDAIQSANASFNQTYTNSLYAGIQWNYNQTIGAINEVNTQFWNKTQTYNKTQIDVFNASWSSTYNATYAQFAYNQTYVGGTYNATYAQFAYNQTYTGGTFNATYSSFAYNQSDGSYNSTYASFAYNQTYTGGMYNATYAAGLNASWNESRANSLYAASQWGYNQTTQALTFATTNFNYTSFVTNLTETDCEAGQLVIGVQANGTVLCADDQTGSATESDPSWTANLTSGASADFNPFTTLVQSLGSSSKRWLKGWFGSLNVTNNVEVNGNVSADYLIGSLDLASFPASACSGTDKVVGMYTNGSVICDTDETGGASTSSSVFQTLNVARNITSVFATSYNQSLFNFSMLANNNYTIDCELWVNSNVTTTGVQINISTSVTPTWMNIAYEHPTTATAVAYTNCNGALKSCVDVSATSILNPSTATVKIEGIIKNAASDAQLNITMKSEVANSKAAVLRESYCELTRL